MDTWLWILIIAAAVLVVLIAAWAVGRSRRTRQLREGFGPEYERTVDERGRRQAESELAERQERREKLDIRPLTTAARDRFLERWRTTQERFVDEPEGAVSDADRLVTEVMRERGYPVDDFEQRAADVSVDHPELVENYRAAHDISRRSRDGQASTEDLRQAMVHYRSLFEELLETRESETPGARTD